MIEIIPAVLPKSLEELERELGKLVGVARSVQIDLAEKNILARQNEMPHWQEFDFEFDLMLEHPEREVEQCIALGASRIVVHAQNVGAREALEALQGSRDGEFAIATGLALQSHDSPEAMEPFMGLYDFVQVMGIDHIGKQGEPPDPHGKAVELVQRLRNIYPTLQIQVDGAVAPKIKEYVAAGATRLVVGSAILTAEDPRAVYNALYTEANAQ